MTDGDVLESVTGFYGALMNGDLELMLSFCAKDAVLKWASFRFEGREGIYRWAAEFRQYFGNSCIVDRSFSFQGNCVLHEFHLYLAVQNGRAGIMPCRGRYELREGKLKDISVAFSDGYLLVRREEVSGRS